MEIEEYKRMYSVEDTYWWYVGLRQLLIKKIKHYIKDNKNIILDAGCGTGGNAVSLLEFGDVYAMDISTIALNFCRKRGLKNVIHDSVSAIPFEKDFFNIVISFDVLSCSAVKDDLYALKGFNKVLKPGGILILNLPAFNFLYGNQDIVAHSVRRYVYRELKNKLEKADFAIEFWTYRNFFLFPLVLLRRCLSRVFKSNTSDLYNLPLPLNYFLLFILRFENFLLEYFRFPLGSSLFCVARKRLT